MVTSTSTDQNGNYLLYCASGIYLVGVDVHGNENGYLRPRERKIELHDGTTVEVNIEIPIADAYVYGRVTVKGAAPSSTFAVYAYNETYGGNWSITDEAGYFTIAVVGAADAYGVSLDD